VARFADTKGYLAGGEERRYAFSFTYRDYVINAFNEDMPYNQFVLEQIAADKLYPPEGKSSGSNAPPVIEDRPALAALGFLTLGRRFLNNQHDIIDDRIDVVTRGTLGLTVACARCHDHKFDPIPTKDYYALHGIFASSDEPAPADLPLLHPINDTPDYEDYLKAKAKLEAEIPEFKAKEVAKFLDELRQNVGDYMLGARDAARLSDQSKFDTFAGERKLNPTVLRRWMSDLEARSKKQDPIFTPWFTLANLDASKFAELARELNFGGATAGNVQEGSKALSEAPSSNQAVIKALTEKPLNSIQDAAEVYNKLFMGVDTEWKDLVTGAEKEKKPAPSTLPALEREQLRQVLYADGTPGNLPAAEAETIIARKLGEGTAPIRNRVQALSWTHPGAPARAMALVDRPNPGNSHVLLRGNPGNPGEEVPRRFLEILSPSGREPFTNGSGRLELARAIVSTNNPLTARVYVNRIWLHHFGEGLVLTPGDFGVRTPEPVHRALLDYLAISFVEHGWSTKWLHRQIMLSSTYQQNSDAQPESIKVDPENTLWTHMNRQRLDFEAMRDTLLALGGDLDPAAGGIPADLETEPYTKRRTVYGLIDRQNLPGLYRTFDFANPDTSSQIRFHTTVPQQALFLMNSPFVIEQAQCLAKRPEVERATSPVEKIQALYEVVLQRPPTRDEIALGEKFMSLDEPKKSKVSPLEKYAQVLLLSNEVMFVD